MGTSASSLGGSGGSVRPLTIVSPVSDWTRERTEDEIKNDDLDTFNHPRLRRLLILQSLLSERRHNWKVEHVSTEEVEADDGLEVYRAVHSEGMLQFFDTAWDAWHDLGEEGRDPSGWSPEFKGDPTVVVPSLVPAVVPFHRASNRQRPSSHVMGQVGYYCTDTVTPVFADLRTELRTDAGVVKRVLEILLRPSPTASGEAEDSIKDEISLSETPPLVNDSPDANPGAAPAASQAKGEERGDATTTAPEEPEPKESSSPKEAVSSSSPPAAPKSRDPDTDPPVIYALTTHPGHHAAHDSFGGYCYVNHVAALARHLQQRQHPSSQQGNCRVAILDVDYHCGNGTASIFYDDPRVLVVSLHCHPDHDYPFHSGFADETGTDSAKGTTLHLPMAPGMEWPNYKVILERGLAKVRNFDPAVCLLSLGLDTHENDPCAIRRAGFKLKTDDYLAMGRTISRNLPGVPLVIVQEGGYLMSKVGEAAANLVLGCCTPGSGTASRSASLVSSSEVAK